MKRALLTLALVACHTPVPELRIALAGPPSQACPSTDCTLVPMSCASVMSIRIVDPADTSSRFLEQCVEVSPNRNQTMCALATVDLEPTLIPVRDLEIQVAVYPLAVIQPDPMKPDLVCPTKVDYSTATGFPVEQAPTPALGGHAFYHPGDDTVVVTLGCTDLAALNESCAISDLVKVTATVDDFDTRFPVMGGSPSLADRLTVSVGEPQGQGSTFVLNPGDTRLLERSDIGPIPTWGGDVELRPNKYTCLEVLENVAQSTATLRCEPATSGEHLALRGAWLAKPQLDEILTALDLAEFPGEGITIGVVVDDVGNPIVGATVSPRTGTVMYLSNDRAGFVTDGTSGTGIFVSRDAPFGTEISTCCA